MIYFLEKEFACPCCGRAEMSERFISKLDNARAEVGVPFRINSGFRCVKHNLAVKGKDNSLHLAGQAADISTVDMSGSELHHLISVAMQDFGGIGLAKNFIHVDNRAVPTVWFY